MTDDFFDSLESQLAEATRRGRVSRIARARAHVRTRIARWVSRPLASAAIALAVSAGAVAAALTVPLVNLASDHPVVSSSTTASGRQLQHGAAGAGAGAVATPDPAGNRGAGTGAAVASPRSAAADQAATPTTPGAIPAGGPVPTGFQPQSFTAIGEFTWWLMGPAPCQSPPCTSIVRTVNGGRSFVGLHAPRTDHVSQLRFANELDGYAFGPQLWSTHDGGESWQRVPIGGVVTQLAAAGGYVFAIVWSHNQGTLMRSPVGADRWQVLGGTAGSPVGGLWVQGATVLVETQNSRATSVHLMVSGDSGQEFTHAFRPPPSVNCSFDATADAQVIWAPCATGMMAGIWRSTDGGRSFQPALGSDAANPQLRLPNSAAFGAADAETAVTGFQRLYRTTDGGTSWQPVQNMPVATTTAYVGFTDATHGVVIDHFGASASGGWRLYYTIDAGASYHYVPISP